MGAGRSCSCAGDTFTSQIDIDSMLQIADTGDIILFNNPMFGTNFIKWTTDSKWDHVGMILKYSENPAETILIESAGCGVFICYARERLKQVLEDADPSIIGWRQLTPRSALDRKWKKEMHREAERLIDTPYEQNFSDFVKAWIGEDTTSKWVLSNLGGSLGEGATKGEDLNSLFCSELAAHMLKHGGLMDPSKERDSNGYAPRDFASQSNAHLDLRSPYGLETEIQVVPHLDKAKNEVFRKTYESTAGASPTEGGNHSNLASLVQHSAASKLMYNRLQLEMAISHQQDIVKRAEPADKNAATATLKELKAELSALSDPGKAT